MVVLPPEAAGVPPGVAVAAAVAAGERAGGQAGGTGRDGRPAAAARGVPVVPPEEGVPVVPPEEGVKPAPETAADCRSQQECTCPAGSGGAPRPVGQRNQSR